MDCLRLADYTDQWISRRLGHVGGESLVTTRLHPTCPSAVVETNISAGIARSAIMSLVTASPRAPSARSSSQSPFLGTSAPAGQTNNIGKVFTGFSSYNFTGWCFATQSGSKSTPNPGPDGTLIFPFAIFNVEVLHSYRMFAPTSLNS